MALHGLTAATVAAMWRAIPVLRPRGLLARDRRALVVPDGLYARFLRVRPWLQRAAERWGA